MKKRKFDRLVVEVDTNNIGRITGQHRSMFDSRRNKTDRQAVLGILSGYDRENFVSNLELLWKL